MPHGGFIENFCKASVEFCESRDVKGLYKRARTGEIKNYTGIDSPYESPEKTELTLDTEIQTVEESATAVFKMIEHRKLIPKL